MKTEGELTRLRDLDAAPGTTEAAVAALVRAGVGGTSPVGSKARVRAAIIARRTSAPIVWLRPIIVVSLLLSLSLVAAAGARAARGPGWMAATVRRLVGWVAPTPAAHVPPPDRTPLAAPATPVEARPLDGTLGPSFGPSFAAPAPAPAGVATSHAPPRLAHRPGHASALVGDDDEPTLVAAAVRALRRDHEASRAATLLDEYLRRWPGGALAEEAMALSIEAAQANGDAGRMRTLAVRYLQSYPSGRFVDTAHRALAPAPAPTP